MKLSVVGLIICIVTPINPKRPPDEVTISRSERVNFLKYQLEEQLNFEVKDQLRGGHNIERLNAPKLANDHYDYVDLSEIPITPIMENDERKKGGKFKLRQLKTTTSTTTTERPRRPPRRTKKIDSLAPTTPPSVPALPIPKPYNPLSDDAIAHKNDKVVKSASKKKKKKKGKRNGAEPLEFTAADKPVDIFYRRLVDPSQRHQPVQWMHCEDLVTPFLTGVKNTMTRPVLVSATHRNVQRLVQLLSINTTLYTKAEIYSLMYQISNVQIRLFQWQAAAIKAVMNVLSEGKRHSFKSLKQGIKHRFRAWHLDFSNTTNLLAQSRLFRPYCVNALQYDGSTKSSTVSKFYPSTSPSTTCDDEGSK